MAEVGVGPMGRAKAEQMNPFHRNGSVAAWLRGSRIGLSYVTAFGIRPSSFKVGLELGCNLAKPNVLVSHS
jgi:hypothetical protein